MVISKRHAIPLSIAIATALVLISAYFSSAGIQPPIVATELLQDGDLIFHASKSRQSAAIHRATHSEISHMGIIFREQKGTKNNWYVYEAVGPVVKTPLQEWIESGADKHYSIRRLKSPGKLSPQEVESLKEAWKRFEGKPYDPYFAWSDQRIYCSELVWKMYKEALGIEVGHLQKLGDFDLNSPVVKELLAERYGSEIPLQETVIAPSTMFNSPLLRNVGCL